MSTRLQSDGWRSVQGDEMPSHDGQPEAAGEDPSLLSEDALTGLPWTETLLPLITSWAGSSTIHAICLHFVGLGILANIPELQSSHSLLKEAADRLAPVMKDHDRLTRFSGNKLLIFSKRPESDVRQFLIEVSDHLESFGVEAEGRHLPEIRIGMATLAQRGHTPAAVDAVNGLLNDAVNGTIPLSDVVAPRQEHAEGTETRPLQPSTGAEVQVEPIPTSPSGPDGLKPGSGLEPGVATPPGVPVSSETPVPPDILVSSEPLVPPDVSTSRDASARPAEEPDVPDTLEGTTPARPAETRTSSGQPSWYWKGRGSSEVTHHTTEIDEETTMITRGHLERTPIRQAPEASPAADRHTAVSQHRLILKAVDVIVTGLVATAVVDLDFEGHKVRGKAIGRSSESHHTGLIAEALGRAVTDLLPAGHGVVFKQAVPTSTDAGEVVVTVVELLTPERTEFLFGVAQTESEPVAGVARSVLNAVNHSLAHLLGSAE
jgi:hypothetical protein